MIHGRHSNQIEAPARDGCDLLKKPEHGNKADCYHEGERS
jgi:hypothetical protein